jgi:hypothetical protein
LMKFGRSIAGRARKLKKGFGLPRSGDRPEQ